MSKRYANVILAEANYLRRMADGAPRLRDRSGSEDALQFRGLIRKVGFCWYEISPAGKRLLAVADKMLAGQRVPA